jgi:hypothetical protein
VATAIDEPTRVLVVVDWTVEATDVVAECRRRSERDPALFVLTVPAWLHGLDWAGDPRASVPCARRQPATLARLCLDAGLAVEIAGVGDPNPISAIGDALAAHAATSVLLCTRERHVPPHPLDLVHRVHRVTGLPVHRVAVRAGQHGGHCLAADERLAA